MMIKDIKFRISEINSYGKNTVVRKMLIENLVRDYIQYLSMFKNNREAKLIWEVLK